MLRTKRDLEQQPTKNKSCQACLRILRGVANLIQDGDKLDIIYCDFSKIFDKMPHGELLSKAKYDGINSRQVEKLNNEPCDSVRRVISVKGVFWQKVTNKLPLWLSIGTSSI